MTPAELAAQVGTDVAQQLWSRSSVVGDCWEWLGSRLPKGYGQISVAGKLFYTHRLAYELSIGVIPAGLHVLHSCDNASCINPEHLRVGTNRENVADKIARGRENPRSFAVVNRSKTHCPSGHPYAGDNLRVDRQGRRICRACKRRHSAEFAMRQKEARAQRDLRPEDRAA